MLMIVGITGIVTGNYHLAIWGIINMTNADKKRWLRRYLDAEKHEARLAEELERVKNMPLPKSPQIDGMPVGGDGMDLATYAALADRVYRDVLAAWEKRVTIRKEVRDAIEAMSNETLKLLMLYRYIDGKSWEEIAVRMQYSYRNVHYLHGEALAAFEVPV